MLPVILSSSPLVRIGPIIKRAEMNWELMSPGISICPPDNWLPLMRSGGYPSSPRYVMSAPNCRKAFTSTPMGRCFILSVPVRVCSPGVTDR